MIFADFGKAVGQIGDPRFARVLAVGLALTVALLFLAYGLLLWLIAATVPEQLTIPFVGPVTWVADLLSWGSLLFLLFLSVFLMVPVASAITSLFLDDVADAVEAAHYPWLQPAPRIGFYEGLRETVNYLGLMIALNIVAIAAYFALPVGIPFIFVALNGFLLGREYFHLIALRRLGREGARAMARRHRGQIWLAGILMALPLSVPLVNLTIPVLGAATFTHLFHRLAGTARPELQGRGPILPK